MKQTEVKNIIFDCVRCEKKTLHTNPFAPPDIFEVCDIICAECMKGNPKQRTPRPKVVIPETKDDSAALMLLGCLVGSGLTILFFILF